MIYEPTAESNQREFVTLFPDGTRQYRVRDAFGYHYEYEDAQQEKAA